MKCNKKFKSILALGLLVTLTSCSTPSLSSESSLSSSTNIETSTSQEGNSQSNSSEDINSSISNSEESSESEFINPGDSLGGGGVVDVGDLPTIEQIEATVDSTLSTKDTATDDSEASATYQINLNNGNTTTDAPSDIVTIAEGKISLLGGGIRYVLQGEFQGQIYAQADDYMQLVFNGVTITNPTGSPLAIFGKKKKVITLNTDTTNTLTDASTYLETGSGYYSSADDEPNACLFAKKALTINGDGKLIINSNYNNGIGCKDELHIVGGDIEINSVNNAIKGNDNVFLMGENTKINITSLQDGIKSDSTDGETYGNVYIEQANVSVTSENDAIQAYNNLYIKSGTINCITGGGAINGESHGNDWGFGSSSSTTTDEESNKGLKSDTCIVILGGNITLDTKDDAVHSNNCIAVEGGTFNIQTGDDGFHADTTLVIDGGNINISKSYEGLEANRVGITGGKIQVVSSDDGINAADGSDSANANCLLHITDGELFVNASGDGLDSNGTMVIDGGLIQVDGPDNGGNAALDSDKGILINGGTVFASGALGMVETPATNSGQNVVSYANSSAISTNTTIVLKDSDSNEIFSFTTIKQSQSIIFSSPSLEQGKTYSLYNSETLITSFTISSRITTIGTTNQGGHGGGPGGGGRP